ncbi:MAG: hypothetical protein JO033_12120, partial [Acidobacteriaceae bacterium]|nr:hypothetical protein [Acidobacteriaceae bacterium]
MIVVLCRIGREWVGFAGEGRERGGDFGEVGADVGGGGARVGAVGVPGVGAGDGVAEVAFDPGECGVPEPVSADLLSGDPGEMVTDPEPEVIVSACGNRPPVGVAQELAVCQSSAFPGVASQVRHERGAHRLPAEG